jgi:8-oxo-(d)GTP phosphatase
MADSDLVIAAGAMTLRRRGGTTEVLLVHRPKYDDWSFPKGKLDPGEDERTAAVREVAEETGLPVRLGPPLSAQVYLTGSDTARAKVVHYWVAWCTGSDDVSGYRPNDEIDEVRWIAVDEAESWLDYERDVALLTEARPFLGPTVPLVVLRHGQAMPRRQWDGNDRRRPLSPTGELQARALVPVLSAYGVSLVVSSSSDRCWRTVAPFAEAAGLVIESTDVLSEEDATPLAVIGEVEDLIDRQRPTVMCGHRPILPMMHEALGLEPTPLDAGAAVVLHHRSGRIVAIERLPAPRPEG